MILFNNVGPVLIYVSDFQNWFRLGWCVKSPQIKLLTRYRPIPNAAIGEDVGEDESFQGREVFIDCSMNYFDERLINFTESGAAWRLFNTQVNNVPLPIAATLPNAPLVIPNPSAIPSSSAAKLDGLQDRLDYGSLVAAQNAGYPMVLLFTKFHVNFAFHQPAGTRDIPPGYTFFHVRPVTSVDEEVRHGPHSKRIIFQATPQRLELNGEVVFKRWNKSGGAIYPTELLNMDNYYIDPSYSAMGEINGAIPGGQCLYVRGVPKNLPNPR